MIIVNKEKKIVLSLPTFENKDDSYCDNDCYYDDHYIKDDEIQ